MRNLLLAISCILTGYNYDVVKECSPAMSRKIYTYAIILILITGIWFFVGKNFYIMYVNQHETPERHIFSIYVGAFAAFMVFVIERIILSTEKTNGWNFTIRFIIGVVIAIIGALVVDQYIFKGDIEIERNKVKGERIDELVASRSKDLKDQLIALEEEKSALVIKSDSTRYEVMKKPYTKEVTFKEESNEKNNIEKNDQNQTEKIKRIQVTLVPHPGYKFIDELNEKIDLINSQIQEKQKNIQQLRENVTLEVEKSFGLIDDLKLLWNLIFGSIIAGLVYFLFFILFLFVELLVLYLKWENYKNGGENEYSDIVQEKRNINRMNRTINSLNRILN
ncbi:MAG: DUF4407 domain-containing protein [Thermaurantimonas sp.]|uniref:DUF4407 domain-containing protein n=1 Tax=Thermaurantimonas sp. TaxID=2681568 RepID=UPI00391B4FB5